MDIDPKQALNLEIEASGKEADNQKKIKSK